MRSHTLVADIAKAVAVSENIGRRMKAATEKALRKENLEIARAKAEKKTQAILERRLDKHISVAVRGVSAIIALGNEKQAKKLIEAREKIKKSFSLYRAYRDGGSAWEALVSGERRLGGYVWGCRQPRDQEIYVDVSFGRGKVAFRVEIEFLSYMNSSGRVAEDSKVCRRSLELSLSPEGAIDEKKIASWLRATVLVGSDSPWVEEDFDTEKGASKDLLRDIEAADACLALNLSQKKYEWEASIVLLGFLKDCSSPRRLMSYLEKALNRVK